MKIDFSKCSKPTDKMISYARAIHSYVKDGYNYVAFEKHVLSKYDKCSAYISKYKSEYRAKCIRTFKKSSSDSAWSINHYADDWGISCSDMGIFPWGNS